MTQLPPVLQEEIIRENQKDETITKKQNVPISEKPRVTSSEKPRVNPAITNIEKNGILQ